MNRIIILVLAVTFSLSSCKDNATSKIKKDKLELAKQRDYDLTEGAPAISFSKTEHDFGQINEGDIVETVFRFKNTGKSELIITNAVGSCGCTVPQWPKEPIAAGASAEISVKFNSNGKPNNQRKTITLTTNTAQGKEEVVIKAQVTPKIKNTKNV